MTANSDDRLQKLGIRLQKVAVDVKNVIDQIDGYLELLQELQRVIQPLCDNNKPNISLPIDGASEE